MHPKYYIDIHIRTIHGPQRMGRFELGQHKAAAVALFESLQGSTEVDEKDMLQMDLVELINELPLVIDILTCSLQELGNNSMLITQEVFRLHNLHAGN